MSAEASRRSLVSRLRERNGEGLPHFVVCGSDALVYTLAEELSSTGQRIRLTVVVPQPMRSDVPDLTRLKGVRVVPVERLDEDTFRSVGLAGADALGLILPDDVLNLHAALCAQVVEPNLRLVMRLVNTALGHGIRNLFASSAVMSDAAMAAPAFVAAALGEVAPTHFRHAGRTLYVARRADVPEPAVVCSLTAVDSAEQVQVLPAEPAPAEAQPADLVLAEATGRPVGQTVAAQRIVRNRRRRRPFAMMGRAVRAALSRKLGVAVLVTLIIMVVSGAVLAKALEVHGFWKSIYLTLLTVVGSSNVELTLTPVAQFAQLLLTLSGVALLPLVTAAVVEGVVNARLALSDGRRRKSYTDHIVLVGLGTVGTRVMRQLTDLDWRSWRSTGGPTPTAPESRMARRAADHRRRGPRGGAAGRVDRQLPGSGRAVHRRCHQPQGGVAGPFGPAGSARGAAAVRQRLRRAGAERVQYQHLAECVPVGGAGVRGGHAGP
jgi:voltage-gated potassium channel Kch